VAQVIAYLLIEDINPIPWQSPDLGIGRTKGGKPFPTASSPANMKAYQQAIKDCTRSSFPQAPTLFPKRTELRVFFFFWRRLDQYNTKNGRTQTGHRADVSNLSKCTEDALQDWLYANDVDNRTVMGDMFAQGVEVDPQLLVIAADPKHYHVLPLFLEDKVVRDLVLDMKEFINPPTPPGNVRLRVTP
jgi:Holliday junction resolvase RusA-like endonuclease